VVDQQLQQWRRRWGWQRQFNYIVTETYGVRAWAYVRDLCVFGYGQTRTRTHTTHYKITEAPKYKIGPTTKDPVSGGKIQTVDSAGLGGVIGDGRWGVGMVEMQFNFNEPPRRLKGLADGSESNLNVQRATQIQSVARLHDVHYTRVCVCVCVIYSIVCTRTLWH